ncbi:hypothetical protein IMAU80188_03019 [Lactiplantibacillus plantarum]|nr:hypothetical protein [Lactiplantibacillus plantarum]MCG0619376.1 hypothetical protein [Lactiplantibacillus plantarum]MCG0807823.1 hypothetical protein [Lactiplantibacillus plantarum]MCG0832768.1 hypothetical protein [Lactiplantibacillus plantarum]MCG0851558.1 hypothetical protein [Lactiplantibacillus plantarum]
MANKNWLKELEVIHKLEARYGSMDEYFIDLEQARQGLKTEVSA